MVFKLLFLIFIAGLLLRFLYFPNNIYFGFDQARDAFAAKEILNGHMKLIGPPTTFEGLHHGVLYYYLYAPFYLIGNGDPAAAAGFLRVINASCIFLVFFISWVLFNKYIGLISALLFAFSFEQTQFALYLNHPSLAVPSILIMILGLAILIFKRQKKGLIIASLGLGLSIQFEFILTYLIVLFVANIAFFRKQIKVDFKTILLSLLFFLISILSFIVSEIKFGFMSFHSLPNLFSGTEKSIIKIVSGYIFEMNQLIRLNLTASVQFNFLVIILLIIFSMAVFPKIKKQIIFLGIWFFSVFIIYIISGGGDIGSAVVQYHPNVGVSVGLLIFISYLIYRLSLKYFFPAILLIIVITVLNLSMILKFNPKGSIPEINAQSFMLLSDEKKVLDYVYKDSNGKLFAMKAITLPFYINTTWSYLFEWYGKGKYGYLPIWGGKNALGYPGNLIVLDAQDKLPDNRYLIIEPVRGIPEHLINAYLTEESYFTKVLEEKKIGSFIVQKRIKK